MLGMTSLSSGWHFEAPHASGVLDSTADGIFRENPANVYAKSFNSSPDTPTRVHNRSEGTLGVLLGDGFELVRGYVEASSERSLHGVFFGYWVMFRTPMSLVQTFDAL